MTDATLRTRSLRALAAAGVLGLMTAPVLAPTAFAAPGDIKVAEHGATPDNSNDPHIQGCDFDVQAFNFGKGTYTVTFTTQNPKPAGIAAADYGFSGPGQFVIQSDKTVTQAYALISKTGKALPSANFHIKVQLDGGGDKVNSKVFWLTDCVAQPSTEPSPSASPSASPTSAPSTPGKVNSGLAGDNTAGIVALGVGGLAVAGLGALGLRRRAGR